SINCPAGHHIREARWSRDREGWVKEYILFWLERKGNSLAYSAWYASAVEDYLRLHPDPEFEDHCLDLLISTLQATTTIPSTSARRGRMMPTE
ncbi:MAG: hypothetical protein II779_13550, partial [Clostridia bacterium]|nr:hypothetical protein [Clostridia bacterium]